MMKLRKVWFSLFILLSAYCFSQENEVQMADNFYKEGKIYVVIAIFSVVLLGLAIYLFFIEQKVKKLEDQLKEK